MSPGPLVHWLSEGTDDVCVDGIPGTLVLGFLVCRMYSKEHLWVNLCYLNQFAPWNLQPQPTAESRSALDGREAVFVCGNFNSSREELEVDWMSFLFWKEQPTNETGAGKEAVV